MARLAKGTRKKVALLGGPYDSKFIKIYDVASGTLPIRVGEFVGRYVGHGSRNTLRWEPL